MSNAKTTAYQSDQWARDHLDGDDACCGWEVALLSPVEAGA